MTEWKPVPGYEGIYSVSDEGQVVRIATYGKHPKPMRRLVHPHRKPNGYFAIDLQYKQERTRTYVHRLVWQAFKRDIPSGLEINHQDGDRGNNRVSNLELVTRSDNMLHCFEELSPSLNRVRGTAHHKAKLTPDDVKDIFRLRSAGTSQRALAKMFGVSRTAIKYVLDGRNWKHVSRD